MVEGLKWLGRRGLVFDVGVDLHRRGEAHLQECLEMMGRAHDGVVDEERVVFVLNHCVKPDLTRAHRKLFPGGKGGEDKEEDKNWEEEQETAFQAWRNNIYTLSLLPKTYMKLSGMLTELDAGFIQASTPDQIFEVVQPWLAVVLATFGPFRTMFGSDWPVCEFGGKDQAWAKWRAVVERMCDMAGLGVEERVMLWSGTAVKAYGLDVQ